MPSASCKTCIHWRALRPGVRNDGPVGECRATPPMRDFTWPRTKEHDLCGKHAPEVSFATPAFVPPPSPLMAGAMVKQQAGEDVAAARQAAQLNAVSAHPEQPLAEAAPLILDAGTTGEAPPAGATTGGTGNRPRSRGR